MALFHARHLKRALRIVLFLTECVTFGSLVTDCCCTAVHKEQGILLCGAAAIWLSESWLRGGAMTLAPFINITELCWVGRIHLQEQINSNLSGRNEDQWHHRIHFRRGITALIFIMCDKCVFFSPGCVFSEGSVQTITVLKNKEIHSVYLGILKLSPDIFLPSHQPDVPTGKTCPVLSVERLICSSVSSATRGAHLSQ